MKKSPLLLALVSLLSFAPSAFATSLVADEFASVAPFSFTMQGREMVSGTNALRIWRANSWDAETSIRVETTPDPDQPSRQVLKLVNLGPARTGVLWLPKREIDAGLYTLALRYRTYDDRWALFDLLIDLPAEQYEQLRASKVASSKPAEGKAGRKFTLLPTDGAEKSFELEFRLRSDTEFTIVIGHAGLGEGQPLLLSGFELQRVGD